MPMANATDNEITVTVTRVVSISMLPLDNTVLKPWGPVTGSSSQSELHGDLDDDGDRCAESSRRREAPLPYRCHLGQWHQQRW